jgi:hypothetical protein
MSKKTTIFSLLVFCLPAITLASMNLTYNQGFETDSGGYPENWAEWSCYFSGSCGGGWYQGDGTTTYREDEGIARSGDDCMDAHGTEYAFSYQDHDGVVVGQEYYLGAYFKDIHAGGSSDQVQLQLEYRDGPRASGNKIHVASYQTAIPNDGEWHLVQMSYVTPASTELITICAGKYGLGNEGTFLYDDIHFGIGPPDGAEIDNPDPFNNQTGVSLNPTLSWTVTGSYTDPSFHVYFGDDKTDVTDGTGGTDKGTQPGTSYVPSTLQPGTYYYWRIDVEDEGKVYTGPVWKFSTLVELPNCLEDLPADLNQDCEVNIIDLWILAQQWLDEFCTPPWCADIAPAEGVNLADFALFGPDWLKSVGGSVVINEFMASNTTVLADDDSEYPDWIEIKNRSDIVVNLEGWYLTDDAGEPDKWQFPDVSIEPDGFLVVFASSKDRSSDPNYPLHTNFNLDITGEYLGLYRPDETVVDEFSPEFPTQAEDISYGLGFSVEDDVYTYGYFLEPTPGAENDTPVSNLGPYIEDVVHSPSDPCETDSIVVTATITPKLKPVDSVSLYYRVMYGGETSINMYDDGAHDDGAADDGTYGATIPAGIANPGQMIRYYITATDPNSNQNRSPLALDLEGMRQSPEYHGMVVKDPALTSNIAVLHWFVENTAAADNTSDRTGTRASIYYNGEFYDNIFVRVRGQSLSGWDIPNKCYKFEFNRGYFFRFSPSEARVDEFNLNSNYPDKAHVRQDLAFESFRDAGGEYCETFPMRVHRNGQFFSVQTFIEQVDEEYLERQGLDPDGALYKMYNVMDSTSSAEKKTREYEDKSDLQALINGLAQSGSALETYLFDNIHLPSVVNYAAVHTIINDLDHGAKNYYAYRDTNGSGEWRYLPWDKELTFGKQWTPTEYLLDDTLWYHNQWQNFSGAPDDDLQNAGHNKLLGAIYSNSRTNQMYHRRLRSLADQLLQAPGTPYAQRYYETRLDELEALMTPDTTLHYNKWADPWAYDYDLSFANAIEDLKSGFDLSTLIPPETPDAGDQRLGYLDKRRTHMYNDHSKSDPLPGYVGNFVDAQVGNPAINIGTIEFNPSSGNQDEEYIQLTNPNSDAVDISGWTITGGVYFTFESGTVIPAGETMYVSPNLAAFRARSTSPKGNEANFVRGNYSGHLSSWGETINLLAADDTLIDTETYTGAPSDQQRYLRVTEMMYHPPDPPGSSPYNDEDFEYIELMNIGPSPLDLTGVRFTNGISFAFPTGESTSNERFIDITDLWRYDDTDTDLGTSWRAYGYDDSLWSQGAALLYYESSELPAPKNTELTLGSITFYFRKHFNLNADPAVDTITLELNTVIDDGAVFYLNGTEVYRLGMHPTDPITHTTLTNRPPPGYIDNAYYEGPFTIPSGSLLQGDNVIAVEVHQCDADSSDIVFGMTLDAEIESFTPVDTVILDPSEFALLTKHTAAFESRYGTGHNIVGQYTGSLDNGGEEIKLEDSTNSTILEFDYNDSWYDITDGDGFSLTIVDVNDTNLDIWDDKDGWRPSTVAGGTPGADDKSTLKPGDIVINELLAHSDIEIYDWIELHNTTDKAVNVGGWFLSDSGVNDPNRMKYEIAAGTVIEPNGYVVFYEDQHFGDPEAAGCNEPFALSENGETLYLQSGQGGVLTGYYQDEDFGASDPDVAFGRHYKASTDSFNFVAMSENTPGSANAYPKVGPIVINEIMYHPRDPNSGSPFYDDDDFEYVELHNIEDEAVTLQEYDNELEIDVGWRFTDEDEAIDFVFPLGTTIPPHGYLVLVKDEGAFNYRYTVPGTVQILEWGDGKLNNGGEKVNLSKPGDMVGGTRYYIRVDRANYSDGSHPVGEDPWPTEPDGTGQSLTRKVASDYGNDVANWEAAQPEPGQ